MGIFREAIRLRAFGIVFFFGAALAARQASAQTPVLKYVFDNAINSSTFAPSTGSNTSTYIFTTNYPTASYIRSAPVPGPSGQASDAVLDLTAASGMGGTGPAASSSALAASQFKSFTLTGWFYNASSSSGGNGADLIDWSSGGKSFDLGFTSSASSYDLSLTVNGATATGQTASTGSNLYGTTGSWVFFAASYNGTLTSNNVTFYVGNTSSLSLAGTFTANAGTLLAATGLSEYGNSAPGGGQAFDGDLDDLSIYGSTTDGTAALSQSQLDAVRTSAVPEPVPLLLILGAIGALALLGRRINAAAARR